MLFVQAGREMRVTSQTVCNCMCVSTWVFFDTRRLLFVQVGREMRATSQTVSNCMHGSTWVFFNTRRFIAVCSGWTGDACHVPDCADDCRGHGVCNGTDRDVPECQCFQVSKGHSDRQITTGLIAMSPSVSVSR